MNYEYAKNIIESVNQYSIWSKGTVLQACRYMFKLRKASEDEKNRADLILNKVLNGDINFNC